MCVCLFVVAEVNTQEITRVLKLKIEGPSVVPQVLRVLDSRFDRIVSLQVGTPSAAGSTRRAGRWPDEWREEKELLLKTMLLECCAVEELAPRHEQTNSWF